MRTTVEKGGVRYQVIRAGVPAWERFVPFKTNGAYRPGGRAFQLMAHEQERKNLELPPCVYPQSRV